ncbi:MAG: rhodanese-like domain-containing protein [Prochlorotrichaceae cyanobacterium]|jgi:rhodanese-related sulfurtransferase
MARTTLVSTTLPHRPANAQWAPFPAQEATVTDITAIVLKDWLTDPRVYLIDVREPAEHHSEAIPQAVLCPQSCFEPQQFPWQSTAIYVCHCRSGKRSQQVAEQLANHYGSVVYNLVGGIEAWKAAGLPVHTAEHLS